MNNSFWSNTIWFLLLGVTTIIELAIVFKRADNRKIVLAVYLTVSGMVFSLEMAVYAYFKAYNYFPMIIPQSPPDDSIAGNIFSQLSISATALLIAVFNLRFYWIVIFAAAYGAIEMLFLELGIYKQNWYRTWMTVTGLIPILMAVKLMYRKSLIRIGRFLRYVYVFYGLLSLHEHIVTWGQRIAGIRVQSESILPDKEQSLVVLSAGSFIVHAVTIMALYFSKIQWYWKLPVIAGLYAAGFLAAKHNLFLYKEGWFFISTTLNICSMYLFTFILDKLYKSKGTKSLQ